MILSLNLLLAPSLFAPLSIQTPEIGLGNRFVIILVAAAIALFSRFILIRLMNRWMMAKSKKLKAITIEESITPEISNTTKIEFEILDSDSNFENTSVHREQLVSEAKKNMNKQLKYDLIVIGVYLVLWLYLKYETYDSPEFFFLYTILFLIWTVMRYVGFRHQFVAYQNRIFRVISPLWKLVFAVFQSRWYMLLALVLIITTTFKAVLFFSLGDILEGVIVLLAVAFHLFMINKIKTKAKQRRNLKLLILRVFLINKTSLFTFNQLAKFWKHFGSYFTVADPSFYKVYWKRNFKHKFPVFILVVFLIYTQMENSDTSVSPFVPFMVLLFLGAIFFIIFGARNMKTNFVSNKDALEKELKKLEKHPIKLDNSFKEKPMSCYDNTWKLTVEKLVNTANVVLMDLRGFSEKNKGCEFEVNLLLNAVSLNKVLFLGYSSAIPLIKDVIKTKFKTLEKSSPNYNINNPKAIIFEVKKETNKEIQQIIDLLIERSLND